jgi:hypothetical protein
MPFAEARAASSSATLAAIASGSQGSGCCSILPASIFEKSRMLVTIDSRFRPASLAVRA